MPKYRKKPVVIEAHQWFKNGDHPADRVGEQEHSLTGDWTYTRIEGAVVGFYRSPSMDGQFQCKHCGLIMHDHGWIDTLEGGHTVCPADQIITGVQGERYPCKPDIFEATYDAVSDDDRECGCTGTDTCMECTSPGDYEPDPS